MTALFVPEVFVGLFVGLIIAMLAVLVLQLRGQDRITKLTYPAYEHAMQQAEHEAHEVIKKAQQQARDIITKAETTARKDIVERQEKIESANEAYFKELEQLHISMHRHLEQVAGAGVTSLTNASDEIAGHAKKQSAAFKEFTTATTADWQAVLGDTTKTLSDQAASAAKTIESLVATSTEAIQSAQAEQRQALADHMATLMSEAKAEVAHYTQGRQQLVDARIADIVADVTAEVLHASLDSGAHATLAREALAAAKREHLL